MAEVSEGQQSQWCLVGNVVEARPYGPGHEETRRGTKHFAPRTKVYCLPAQWGDGYEDIIVIGRHRGSRRYVRLVMPARFITNWRAKVVYSPEVLRLIDEATTEPWRHNWSSEHDVEAYAAWLLEREINSDALATSSLDNQFRPERKWWEIWKRAE